MNKFSEKSQMHLDGCHPLLKRLFEKVLQVADCTIIEGYRNFDRQDEMYRTGKSQLRAEESKHNKDPSRAVDVMPYPKLYKSTKKEMREFATIVETIWKTEIPLEYGKHRNITWGGNWDFYDAAHWEIKDDS